MPLVDVNDPALWERNYISPLRADNGVVLHYHRARRFEFHESIADAYVRHLGLTPASKVLILGCGYAWSQEWLEAMLPGITVVSVDTSGKIQADKGDSETADIEAAMESAGIVRGSPRWNNALASVPDHAQPKARRTIHDEDVSNGGSRNRLRSAGGLTGSSKFDWGISEEVLPWLTDQECLDLDSAGRNICTNIAHLLTEFKPTVNPEPGQLWNWKWARDTDEPTRADLAAEAWYTTPSWKRLLPNSTIIARPSLEAF